MAKESGSTLPVVSSPYVRWVCRVCPEPARWRSDGAIHPKETFGIDLEQGARMARTYLRNRSM